MNFGGTVRNVGTKFLLPKNPVTLVMGGSIKVFDKAIKNIVLKGEFNEN